MFTIDELKNYPLNWTDGMRVGSKDFAATDTAWSEALRDVRVSVLQGAQFGLLPALRDKNDKSGYPKFQYDPARGTLTLVECRAITEGGYRVEITEDLFREHQIPAELPACRLEGKDHFDVYITVDMGKKEDSGPMSADAPPRRLYKSPLYELSAISKSEGYGLSGVNHLKIAEFVWQDGKLQQDGAYLPPCVTIHTHPSLMERHQRSGVYLKSVLENSVKIVQDYRFDQRPDVRDATVWMEKLVGFLSSSIWTYNDLLPGKAPAETVVFLKNWLQFVLSTAQIHKGNQYLKDGLDSQREFFEEIAKEKFDYSDLRSSFDKIETTLDRLRRWLKAVGESFKVNRVIKVEEVK